MKGVSVIDLAALRQVPGSVIGMRLSAREAVTAFADIVYADQQWTDAEFDSLIAASFGKPPLPPAPPRVPPHPGTPPPPSGRPVPNPALRTLHAAGPDRGRERSPPLPSRSAAWPPLACS
jgi:hypothetical protein